MVRAAADPRRGAPLQIVATAQRQRERARQRLGLSSTDELQSHGEHVFAARRQRRDRAAVDAIAAMQDLLRCTGRLQGHYERFVFDAKSALALRDFQLENMIISSGALDADTRKLLVMDSRERVVRAALRERVADAAGLIWHGSAASAFGQVLGRAPGPPD